MDGRRHRARARWRVLRERRLYADQDNGSQCEGRISGQTGRGPNGIPDDLGEQADIAWAGVVAQLEAAGATVNNVIKTNTYIVDIDPDRVRAVGKPMMKYFPQENKPASTWVGVTGLVSPELKVEIEAIAVTEAE